MKGHKKYLLGLIITSLLFSGCNNINKPVQKVEKEIKKVEEKTEKPEEKEKETKKVVEKEEDKEMDMDKYNKFVNESYNVIFKDYIMDTKEKNLIYSPYSYKMALEGVGKVTNAFNEDDYLSEAVKSNMPQNLDSVKTKNLVMLDKMNFDTQDKDISLVLFPDEGKELSIKTQKEVLGHVLLEPMYTVDTRFVSLNATKFESKWEKPFEITEKDEFNAFNDVLSDKDFLYGEIDKVAYTDEDVEVGRKELKEEGSYVYFVSPKKFERDNLEKVASKISEYVKAFEEQGTVTKTDNDVLSKSNNNVRIYDEVNVNIPKIDAESTIDILKAEANNGHAQLIDNFDYKDSIKSAYKQGSIDYIMQVANMKLDEEGVKAEAVTEMVSVMSMLPEEKEKDILDIDCSHPHFVVCVSQGVITFIGFIGY